MLLRNKRHPHLHRFYLIILFNLVLKSTLIAARECPTMDVRNSANMLQNLRGCTVIKGNLIMVLMEKTTEEDFNHVSFPELKEITGFFLLYRVVGLQSVGRLFPNLTIIRGEELFEHYALVLYEMYDLAELGLRSLLKIQKGRIKILTCPVLCYVNTIDWSKICDNPGAKTCVDRLEYETRCPSKDSCKGCENKNCWSRNVCQKTVHDNLVKPSIDPRTCNRNCLGGCYNSSFDGCHVCKDISYQGGCYDKCPDETLLYREFARCVDHETCEDHKRLIHDHQCLLECPADYSTKNYETNIISHTECFPCPFRCPKICTPSEIYSLQDSAHLKGCTILDQSLKIRINSDVNLEELEKNLGDIEEIQGHLKVYRSLGITTLSFLKNLKTIGGGELDYDRYAIVVYENDNLQTLWNWQTKKRLEIKNGGMFFHSNNKLCPKEIKYLQEITTYNSTYDFITKFPNQHSCDPIILEGGYKVLSESVVTVYWKQLENTDPDKLEYLIYYIKSPKKDAERYIESDACLENNWVIIVLKPKDLKLYGSHFAYNITELNQYTQYAFFVRTYETSDDAYKNARTDIEYFTTEPDIPTAPVVYTYEKTHNTITFQLKNGTEDREFITHYVIDVFRMPDNRTLLDTRDYCLEPMVIHVETIEINEDSEEERKLECCKRKAQALFANKNQANLDLAITFKGMDEDEEMEKFKRSMVAVTNEKLEKKLRKRSPDPYEVPAFTKYKDYIKSDEFDALQTTYKLDDLEPYRMYTVHLSACNPKTGCGSYYMYTTRTAKLETADDVNLKVVPGTPESGDVYLLFEEPMVANGMIVGYEISMKKHGAKAIEENHTCITRLDHEFNHFNYTIKGLEWAPYQFRVRAMSLAGFGKFTEWQVITFGKPKDSTIGRDIALVCLGGVIVAACSAFLYQRYKLDFHRPEREDEAVLMTELSRRSEMEYGDDEDESQQL